MPHVYELHEHHDRHDSSWPRSPRRSRSCTDRDQAVAQSLVDSCAECAATPRRPPRDRPRDREPSHPRVRTRDFQLSPEQAARLRPGGWRRFVAAFAAPGSIFTQAARRRLATLGIVGLLIGAAPSIQLGGLGGSAASAPAASMPAAAAGERSPAPCELRGARGVAPRRRARPRAAASAPPPRMAAAARPRARGFDAIGCPSRPGTSPAPPARRRRPRPTARHRRGRRPERPGRRRRTGRHPAPAPASVPSQGDGPSGLVIASSILLAAGLLVLLLRSIGRRAAAG